MEKALLKHNLFEQLKAANCFWSYADVDENTVSDDMLIEKTLIHLDLPDIKALFDLYGTKRIKEVWLHQMVPQGDYLYSLNRFIAWYYFGIKQPRTYLKQQESRQLHKRIV